jgi:hypothetical protein
MSGIRPCMDMLGNRAPMSASIEPAMELGGRHDMDQVEPGQPISPPAEEVMTGHMPYVTEHEASITDEI